MRLHQVFSTLLLCGFLFFSASWSQGMFSSGGTTIVGSGGSFTLSLGQLVQEPIYSPEGSFSPLLAPIYDIAVVSIVPQYEARSFSPELLQPNRFANPVLFVREMPAKGMRAILLDASGRQLQSFSVEHTHTEIELTNRAPGTYFLRTISPKQQAHTFKITKRQP